jgi:GNAT superfamily N-acetyltransferase
MLSLHVESGEFAEIAGLVIDLEHRGRGIGERLLRRAEAWARECGVDRVRVRTNVRREDAHRFYERLGYVREKSQHVFQRKLWRI